MPRIVLLGLGNDDVDVLTRLADLDPSPEVLAVHPDPEALILRLAAVASYPALTEPPRPREGDIVVVPSTRGPLDAQMVRPWREVGARILLPDAPALTDLVVREREREAPVLTGAGVADRESRTAAGAAGPRETASKPPEEKASTVVATEDSGAEPPRPAPPVGKTEDGAPRVTPPSAPPPPAPAARVADPASTPAGEPAAPPASVWDSPEETFRYLAGQVFGPDRAVSLWWDGDAGVWVPWVWTGPAPARRPELPAGGIEVPARWGSFRLGVSAAAAAAVPLNAFTRVAEDIALRDLMIWRDDAARFAALGLPAPDADAATLRRWVEPLLAYLDAPSVLVWKREGDRCRLLNAVGAGLELSGSLVMPATMVAASFETGETAWRRWEPVPGLLVHLAADREDPRRPLRLRRLELALAKEDARR